MRLRLRTIRVSPIWLPVEPAPVPLAPMVKTPRDNPAEALFRDRGNTRAGVRLVKIKCASCNREAAVIEEHPAGTCFADYPGLYLLVRSSNITRRHLQSVYCERDGRLGVSWVEVLTKAQAAKHDGRVGFLRARTA